MAGALSRSMAAAFAACAIASAFAAPATPAYPERPVRIVVPYAPGGGGDTLARLLGARLGEAWSQVVVVDNRPGGGTTIGTDLVAKSQPDGHTLLLNTAAFTINPALLPKLPFDVLRDFAPVTQVAILPNLLVVHPGLPAKSVREFIAYAKTRKDLAYGSSGTGTGAHLAGELFRTMAGIELVHVPYKGGGAVIPDLLAGRIQLTFATLPSSIGYVRAGKLRALAVATTKRSPGAPEIPTIAEAGLPGYDADNWIGLLAPAGTPAMVVKRIQEDVRAVVDTPEVREKLISAGFDPIAGTPSEFASVIRADLPKWKKAVEASGAKAD